VDVAGTNLRQETAGVSSPAQCDALCKQNATGCSFWIFVASRPEQAQFQAPFSCFAKDNAFRGENGYTGKPKTDIWVADSQVWCAVAWQ
jgi:hypothetical protein